MTKQSQTKLDAFLNKEPGILFMMRQFFIKFDVPHFYDKRLNQTKVKNRLKIKRKKDEVDDDVNFQNKNMPDLSKLKARVAMSSDLQLDAASKEIDALMDHKIWNDKSNTIL